MLTAYSYVSYCEPISINVLYASSHSFDLGSGPVSIVSTQSLQVGYTYNISVERYKNILVAVTVYILTKSSVLLVQHTGDTKASLLR